MANRVRRDGAAGIDRGSSQTHGAGDPSGVDVEPDIPPLRFGDELADHGDDVVPPSQAAPS
ncbi:hypothetical protein [Actinomycetospora sp. CA-084318]|uniref:hypothetical protein n=1 Tax=Actinomycetospora sp. CA-084318 TaxID=3239892 RepID=UPI003D9959CE